MMVILMKRNNDIPTTSKKDNESIWVTTFCYSFDSELKKGIAIFVKHPLLPLYRMEDVYIEKQMAQTDFITAVDNLYGIHY